MGPRSGFRLVAVAVAAFVEAHCAFANDLGGVSDEFNVSSTLSNWSRVNVTEGWNADQLESLELNTTTPGQMVVTPFTCSWYQDWRGPMIFKLITGDFVVTTSVQARGRDGVSVPQSQYSLAGLMIRTPRAITPGTWTPGGENYVFFSTGHGNNGGSGFQFEDKTTINSNSTLILSNSIAGTALLQIARLGNYVILLRQEPGQPWVVHRRFARSDFPATLQVGAVTYTDWQKASVFTPFVQNSNVLDPPLGIADPNPGVPFNPDLTATFDFIRLFRPTLPVELQGVNLTNTTLVPDAALIAFLGSNANVPAPMALVHADFGYAAKEEGTSALPFNTLAEALARADDGATIRISGSSSVTESGETFTGGSVIDQVVTIQADPAGGGVRIGVNGMSRSRSTTGFISGPR